MKVSFDVTILRALGFAPLSLPQGGLLRMLAARRRTATEGVGTRQGILLPDFAAPSVVRPIAEYAPA